MKAEEKMAEYSVFAVPAKPAIWKTVPLGEVLEDIVGGGTPSRSNPAYWEGNIPWLTVKDMRSRRPQDSIDHISEDAVRGSATNLIPADTVIIATRIGLGKVIRVPYDATINQDLKALITKPIVDKGYLEYWIVSIANYLDSIGSGTTVKGIRLEQLRSIPFPLAPLDQQKRIVAEIEKQFSRLDEAVANLKRVKANLKRYKAAVLKAAVSGRLVETEAERARREGRSYETGEQLLQRILETRRSQWQGKGKYKEPAAPDSTDLPELPEGWVWASVNQIAVKVVDGTHHTPEYVTEGIPFISVKDVRDGTIHFDDTRFISPFEHDELTRRCNPEIDDVLITKSGTIGRTAVIATDRPFSLFVSVALIKPVKPVVISRHLQIALDAYIQSIDIAQDVKGGLLKNLHLEDLRLVAIPIPPGSEQHRIVAEVDRRLSLLRETEAQVDANLQRAERLRQSILAQAFSGRLKLWEKSVGDLV